MAKHTMRKIALHRLPRLKGLTIITCRKKLEDFLKKAHREHGRPILALELEDWVASSTETHVTFFAFYNEEDDLEVNDGWGHYELYKCIAVRTPKGKIFLFKTMIERFMH